MGADFAQAVLTGPLLLAAGAAALAGLVSFVSPCVLPLVPGYVGYVTGLSGSSLKDKETWRVVLGITLFVLGFTIVFVILGTGFSALGALFSQWQDIVIRILGVGVMIAGLVFMGAFGFLQRERRIQKKPKAGLWGAPVLGATFAIGWAPCVGPTLSAVLTMSLSFGSDGTLWRGAFLAFVYCLGLGIPFIFLAIAIHKGAGRLSWVREHQTTIVRIGGALLIALGFVMAIGLWNQWMNSLQGLIYGFEVVI
ncbi:MULTISPECIES: cytochrome c biogenesis CcdA family protein [Brevibacterium]|uniref:Cytochrome C biogenesis protein CcdA n=1 Tax=Brevibacterium casei TaxID=33889 RepID=A0A165ED79_9MICO|nr:cytochrome c biogenesis protein CcdA [Brevibacterium casei]NJE65676.1 cytochrome C biogenesis protein CcdA [Brevibacterium sp. LS14]KZE22573.1 cytochrome C biogenesis protein ResC [Brevibacterium casei]MBE4695493.1 cytochrome C biogenesis protein CcdA [Brevibacterium casei]MBY3578615.1 cytochrome C biogenesis protein CcdA [Brevibacterium casei]MCT1552069.1 cytochrome C biogenesis protein CcdA [Brevibacterium casei]